MGVATRSPASDTAAVARLQPEKISRKAGRPLVRPSATRGALQPAATAAAARRRWRRVDRGAVGSSDSEAEARGDSSPLEGSRGALHPSSFGGAAGAGDHARPAAAAKGSARSPRPASRCP
eukprot:1873719-Pyramimonas_sp.AAC.1